MYKVKRGYPVKKTLYLPNIAPRVSECENNL